MFGIAAYSQYCLSEGDLTETVINPRPVTCEDVVANARAFLLDSTEEQDDRMFAAIERMREGKPLDVGDSVLLGHLLFAGVLALS